MRLSAIFFISLALAVSSKPAFAELYSLFVAPGRQIQNYDEVVRKLKSGDVVQFSNGRRYTLVQRRGSGQNTLVWEINGLTPDKKARVLRIPLKRGKDRNGRYYTTAIDQSRKGYKSLREEGVPVPLFTDSRSGEYIVAEKLDIVYDLYGFLKSGHNGQALTALLDFARKTARISEIGDFNGTQLVYTRDRGWVLLDWSNELEEATHAKSRDLFEMVTADLEDARLSHLIDKWLPIHHQIASLVQAERAQCTGTSIAERLGLLLSGSNHQ